eukprot:7929179-Lingulodinium_polyedra.AAC.1
MLATRLQRISNPQRTAQIALVVANENAQRADQTPEIVDLAIRRFEFQFSGPLLRPDERAAPLFQPPC